MSTQTALETTEGHAPAVAALKASSRAPTALASWNQREAGEIAPRETRAYPPVVSRAPIQPAMAGTS